MHASILKYLSAVARTGSIRAASEELHVASSAISRQIKQLEDTLGMQVFERLPDGVRLTRAGEVALEHAREVLKGYDLMRSDLGNLEGKSTGTVRVTCLDSLSVWLLPRTIGTIHSAHPEVNFRVQNDSYNSIFRRMIHDDFDIGITFDFSKPNSLQLVSSVKAPLMVIVAKGHPIAGRRAVTLGECSQYELLLQLDNDVMSSMISLELAALTKIGRTFVACNSQALLKPLILAGQGIAFYTPLGLIDEIETGDLVAIPLVDNPLSELEIGIFIPRNRRISHATQLVVETVDTELKMFERRLNTLLEYQRI